MFVRLLNSLFNDYLSCFLLFSTPVVDLGLLKHISGTQMKLSSRLDMFLLIFKVYPIIQKNHNRFSIDSAIA